MAPGSGRRLLRAAFAGLMVVACTSSPVPPPLPLPAVFATPTPPGPRPVTVRVVGPSGDVPDAKVCATRTGGEELCATSGPDGRATVRIVPGTYAVRAIPLEGRRLAEGVVTVDLTDDVSTVVVTLDGRTTISGTVRDEAGSAVREAEACAHGATRAEVKCVRTRADGGYTVEVRPGIQKVELKGAPGSRLLTQWARGRIGSFEADLIDTRTHEVTGVDVILIVGVVLSGVVTAARDGSVVKDAQVCTYTLAAPLGWDCENTDKNGRYALLREPGRYWVWTIAPEARGSRLMYQRHDRVLEGVNATPFTLLRDAQLDVALTEGTVVRGRVTASDGTPVVVALVCIDTPFPTGRICRGTGDDGSYEIATRPEAYVVNVIPPDGSDVIGGFWPDAQPDWTRAGEVRVGRADVRLDIVLPRGVRLSGTIRDARGAPVEGATINVNDGPLPSWFGSTDLQGHYSVALPPGTTYTVDVFPPRASPSLSVMGQRVTVATDTGYDVVLPDAAPE